MNFLRAIAPFLLALLLLFDGIKVDAGAKWFKERTKTNLGAMGISDDRHVDDIWEDAKAATQPLALATRSLVTLLGLYLLLPTDSDEGWLFGLLLFAGAIGCIWLANAIKPKSELPLGKFHPSTARSLSVVFIAVGMAAATLKTIAN